MTLKPCRDCGREVSPDAETCPQCGAAAPARRPSKQWIPCPRCGSAKTTPVGAGVVAFASFATGGCLLWIPIIGWLLAPVMFIVAIVAAVSAVLPSGSVVFQCQSCKQWTRKPKSELE